MGAVPQSLSLPIYLLAMHDFLQKERRSLTQRSLQVTFVPGPAPELQWMLGWTFWLSGISMNTLFNTKSLNTLELLCLLQTGKHQEEENTTLSNVLTLLKKADLATR